MRATVKAIVISSFAFILAAPHMADAKSAHHGMTAQDHGRPCPPTKPQPKQIDKTISGQFVNTKVGGGTYTETITGTARDRTITTVRTLDDGQSSTTTANVVLIKNQDGSLTRDVTTTGPNGKTTTRDLTQTATGTAGDYSYSGTFTQANGTVDTVSGTKDATSYGTDTGMTYTNAKGQTKTTNDETMRSGDAIGNVVTGVGFQGQTISFASLRTNNALAAGQNTVVTTVDGPGTYTVGSSVGSNGATTLSSTRNFGDTASSGGTTVITPNSDGTTTISTQSNNINSKGTQTSNGTYYTYAPSGTAHNDTISGTFSQSNGNQGTVVGTGDVTTYGYNTGLTYTNQTGQQRTADTQTLVIGDAVLNVNGSSSFAGTTSSSAGLITGSNAQYVQLNHPEAGL